MLRSCVPFFPPSGHEVRLAQLSQSAPYSHARAKRASRTTSWTEEVAPSDPPGTRSRRNIATALPAAHPSTMFQRRHRALRASPWSSSGSLCERGSAVSLNHRPPTSAPSTTSLARPPSPASSEIRAKSCQSTFLRTHGEQSCQISTHGLKGL